MEFAAAGLPTAGVDALAAAVSAELPAAEAATAAAGKALDDATECVRRVAELRADNVGADGAAQA